MLGIRNHSHFIYVNVSELRRLNSSRLPVFESVVDASGNTCHCYCMFRSVSLSIVFVLFRYQIRIICISLFGIEMARMCVTMCVTFEHALLTTVFFFTMAKVLNRQLRRICVKYKKRKEEGLSLLYVIITRLKIRE